MEAHSDSQQFVEQLRIFASGRLNFPQEVTDLLDLSRDHHLEQVFLDAIFHAKFAVKTKDIMSRIGRDAQGYDKLSAEFQNSVEKTTTLLKTIFKEAPAETKQRFVNGFLRLDQESFGNLTKLLEDLSWVKNWEVDGRPLPLRDVRTPDATVRKSPREALSWITKSSVLGVVLMVILLISDPPVTYLGWGIAVVVVLLLLVIVVSSHTIKKSSS